MTTLRRKKSGQAPDDADEVLEPDGVSAGGGEATPMSQRPAGYAEWLTDLKSRVHAAQQRAALAVNTELLQLYWSLGRDLSNRRREWGAGVISQVSLDLRSAFPEMKGFSPSNLKYMRAFAEAWPDGISRQQPVGDLPWGHNVVLLTRLSESELVAEYALQSSASPIGVAEYRLVESLPTDLEASLPSIARIEEALSGLATPQPARRAKRAGAKKRGGRE